ncbi:MAG TPA: DEAD/DEAH box helicase [Propionibacteriaceae bacterium]|nr:DEAD/DEAH box helicase [Propionibacteriaceae bacterium]
MPAKSRKADGTPKVRWSAADRAARGHAPRRRGGQPRKRTVAVSPETSRSPERSTPARPAAKTRPVREQPPVRKPRAVRPERRERPERPERPERQGRPERFERVDRPERQGRPERPGRVEQFARQGRAERMGRPGRPERSQRVERPGRAEGFERPGRPERFESRSAEIRPASPSSHPAPNTEAADFAELGLPDNLSAALAASGISAPFPIQAATIPAALAGRDVLGRAQTGSGKTLAFGLPMLARLAGGDSGRGRAPRGLVLAPTRELAMQVSDVLAPLAQIAGMGVVLVAGGMSYTPQQRAFERGVDVVVATPGRLIDLMDQGVVDLGRVEVTVLDEADHMADLGFMPAVTQILDTVPGTGQRLLFSATLDEAVDQLVRRYLPDPVTVSVDAATASVATMTHLVVPVAPADKVRVTAELAGRPGRTIVFVRTQMGADRVAEQLRAEGVLAGALHGGLAQGLRTRILGRFRDGSLPTLVATDVAARGIHVDDVGLVLQVDPPHGSKEYLHRAGRTARAGGKGQVVTLALPHQRRDVRRLLDRAGVRGVDSAFPEDLSLGNGNRSTAEPISEADYLRLVAPPTARPSGRRRTAPRRSGH